MATSIVRDNTVSFAGKEERLIVPVVRTQWPSVTENNGWAVLAPKSL